MQIDPFIFITFYGAICSFIFCLAANSKIGATITVVIALLLFIYAGISNNTMTEYTVEEAKIEIAHDRATFPHNDKIYNANELFKKQLKEGQIIEVKKYKPSLGLYSDNINFYIKETKCENN